MNLINLAIESLWYWTYGIIVGWGASFTILLAINIILFLKIIRIHRRMTSLENRLITLDREVSLTFNELNK